MSESFSLDKFMEVESGVIGLDGIVFKRLGGFGVFMKSFGEHWSWFSIIKLIVNFLELVLTRRLFAFIIFVVKIIQVMSILKINLFSIFILVIENKFLKRLLQMFIKLLNKLGPQQLFELPHFNFIVLTVKRSDYGASLSGPFLDQFLLTH